MCLVSTHSRPKAAGSDDFRFSDIGLVSTHSRPKAAGLTKNKRENRVSFQHTAARRRLATGHGWKQQALLFQHTAARRRLGRHNTSVLLRLGFNTQPPEGGWKECVISNPYHIVSTHSRPKAAGIFFLPSGPFFEVSTHSRPKAAGADKDGVIYPPYWFQHTAARRRLVPRASLLM